MNSHLARGYVMARKRKRRSGPNQSQFIRDLFAVNPNAKLGDAKKAWADAGNSGPIGNSLFYVIKRKAGLTKSTGRGGKRRGRPPGSKNKVAAPQTRRNVASGYEAVEERLDEVIQLLWQLGDNDLVAEFKGARRKIAAKLV
jgi:hypothetical protein